MKWSEIIKLMYYTLTKYFFVLFLAGNENEPKKVICTLEMRLKYDVAQSYTVLTQSKEFNLNQN